MLLFSSGQSKNPDYGMPFSHRRMSRSLEVSLLEDNVETHVEGESQPDSDSLSGPASATASPSSFSKRPFYDQLLHWVEVRDYVHETLAPFDKMEVKSRPYSTYRKWILDHKNEPFLRQERYHQLIENLRHRNRSNLAFPATMSFKPFTDAQRDADPLTHDLRPWQLITRYKFPVTYLIHQSVKGMCSFNPPTPSPFEGIVFLIFLGKLYSPLSSGSNGGNSATRGSRTKKGRVVPSFRRNAKCVQQLSVAVQVVMNAWNTVARGLAFPAIGNLIAPYIIFDSESLQFRVLSAEEGFAPYGASVSFEDSVPVKDVKDSFPSAQEPRAVVADLHFRRIAKIFLDDLSEHLIRNEVFEHGWKETNNIYIKNSMVTPFATRFDKWIELLEITREAINAPPFEVSRLSTNSSSPHDNFDRALSTDPISNLLDDCEDLQNTREFHMKKTGRENFRGYIDVAGDEDGTLNVREGGCDGDDDNYINYNRSSDGFEKRPSLSRRSNAMIHSKMYLKNYASTKIKDRKLGTYADVPSMDGDREGDCNDNGINTHCDRDSVTIEPDLYIPRTLNESDDIGNHHQLSDRPKRRPNSRGTVGGEHVERSKKPRRTKRRYKLPRFVESESEFIIIDCDNNNKNNVADDRAVLRDSAQYTGDNGVYEGRDCRDSGQNAYGREIQDGVTEILKEHRIRSSEMDIEDGEKTGSETDVCTSCKTTTVGQGRKLLKGDLVQMGLKNLPRMTTLPRTLMKYIGALWHIGRDLREMRRQPTNLWPEPIVRDISNMEPIMLMAVEASHHDLYTQESSLRGGRFGVFTSRNIVKGELICHIHGTIVYECGAPDEDENGNGGGPIIERRTVWVASGEGSLEVDVTSFNEMAVVLPHIRFRWILSDGRVVRRAFVVPSNFSLASQIVNAREGAVRAGSVNAKVVFMAKADGLLEKRHLCLFDLVSVVATRDIKNDEEICVDMVTGIDSAPCACKALDTSS